MHVQTVTDWRRDNGFTHPYTFHPVAAEYLLTSEQLETTLVYDGEEDELFRLRFPSGRQLVGHWSTSLPDGEFRLYAKGPDSEPTPHDIRRTFWDARNSVKLVASDSGPELEGYSPWDESSYDGSDYELVNRWGRFLDEGINRSVYLYGEGNAKKLEFCDRAARELGQQIIRLDGSQLEVGELPRWRRVLELISPDIVIVEEVTGLLHYRARTQTYRTAISFFEQCHESPLTLLCGEERDDGYRLDLRPGVVDEFQQFQGGQSQPEPAKERVPTVRETSGWEEWNDFDDLPSPYELWRKDDAIRLSAAAGQLVAKSIDLEDVHYHGPHVSLYRDMSKYVSEVSSRKVLLRAPIGAGKMTLALRMAREWMAREASPLTLVIDPGACRTLGFREWREIVYRRRPKLLVFTGVTPDTDSELSQSLQTLHKADLPLSLYLSDDVEGWTTEAEETYGFDRVVDVRKPEREDRLQVIQEFADEFDMTIPDDRVDFLDTLYCERSPRRVREALFRASTWGWSHLEDVEGDVTFRG